MKITVVGLGSGGVSDISLGAFRAIREARFLYLRTEKHPVVDCLSQQGIQFRSFDCYYESGDSFEEVYASIVEELICAAKANGEIVYAVPGHPRVAETTVDILLSDSRIKQYSIELEIIPSNSFLDNLFIFLDVDPSKRGFTVLDALQFDLQSIRSQTDIVFTQVYDRRIASELKLKLMECLRDESRVILFKAAGVEGIEEKIELKLFEIDRSEFEFDHLTSVYIPFVPDNYRHKTIYDLMRTIEILRSEEGCPWDRKQTPTSIIPNMYEEMEELVEAIKKTDIDNIVEELGDVLMLLAMQARFGEEDEYFNMPDVVDGIVQKLIFRHPHVFGNDKVSSIEEANEIWEHQKMREKN